MSKPMYRKPCLECDRMFNGTEEDMFCSDNCAISYQEMIARLPGPKETVQEEQQRMSPEEKHLFYMLLHNMMEITICATGFAYVQYFPHHDPNFRIAYGVCANVTEQIVDKEQYQNPPE